MGILDFFKKKNAEGNVLLSAGNFSAATVEVYKTFYDENKDLGKLVYGLIPFGDKSAYPGYYRKDFEKNVTCDFQFDKACVWEEIEDEKLADTMWNKAVYGNIPVAELGCGSYFVLISSGKHAGEIWLLTEMGITPIRENFGLNEFLTTLKEEQSNFWYPAVKDWGPFEYAFFASHAIPQNITYCEQNDIEVKPLGVLSNLCESCTEFVRATAMRRNQNIVITDSGATRVFFADGRIEKV